MSAKLQHDAEALGATLPPLLVEADHLAASVSLGVHGRRRTGTGESFWQFRRYRSQDAVTAIDWRQSAKSQHLFVREREWEAAQTVWLWRDGGSNMDFASGPEKSSVTKKARADLLLLALASLLVRGGERVGYWAGGDPAAASKLSLSRIARRLMSRHEEGIPPSAPVTRGAQLVWFGDFLDPATEAAMTRISRAGIEGHLVRIVDPAEEEFPYAGRMRFEIGQGSKMAESEIFGRAERLQSAYRAKFIAHGEAIASAASRLGWSATVHRTDHAPQAALIALYGAIGGL
ncbi:MAG TPA: DUF58 domain-containing protein [Rhizomicrobium sp.]|nr:DUF58 domain-containing protein [Rhizomicrobium sp.]